MRPTEVPIALAFSAKYMKRRGRIAESSLVATKFLIMVDNVDTTEAPAVFRIERPLFRSQAKSFEVRRFDGNLWWPVGESDVSRTTKTEFEEGVAHGLIEYLGLLHEEIKPISDAAFDDEAALHSTPDIREHLGSDRDRVIALAQKGASQIIFCDGFVYQKGGDPVLSVGLPVNAKQSRRAVIDIVDAQDPKSHWESVGSLGYSRKDFYDQAQRGLIFRLDEIDDARAAVKEHGAKVYKEAKADVMIPNELTSRTIDIRLKAVLHQIKLRLSATGYANAIKNVEALESNAPILFQHTPISGSQRRDDFFAIKEAIHAFVAWCDENNAALEACRPEYRSARKAIDAITKSSLTERPSNAQRLDQADELALQKLDI